MNTLCHQSSPFGLISALILLFCFALSSTNAASLRNKNSEIYLTDADIDAILENHVIKSDSLRKREDYYKPSETQTRESRLRELLEQLEDEVRTDEVYGPYDDEVEVDYYNGMKFRQSVPDKRGVFRYGKRRR